ncbi:MAG: DUF2723 domain-containing protein [Bacteroidota bacterium]
MTWKQTERLVAAAVFVYAFVLYLLTMAPTASFWDAGEFIASVYGLEVMHPPGAPLYMLVGRLFTMFVPPEHVAVAVNLISVLASALTVLLTHASIVRLVREWQPALSKQTTTDRITALAGGVIGATTFAVTDSFWFNAVEAEVYASSMLFTAAVVWLVLVWREQALQEEAQLSGGKHPFGLTANRYLVVIAYLFGLAIGVHLLNLLALFFIALVVFYTEFEKGDWPLSKVWTGIVITGAVSILVFGSIYPGIIQVLPDLAGRSGSPLLFFLFVMGLVAFGVWYTHRQRLPALNLVMLCITVILIGYSTYALIFIRSAADPPIDLNDPETPESFVSFLKREQYGATPLLTGATYSNSLGRIDESEEVTFPRRWSPDPNHIREYDRYSSDGAFFWQYQVGHMYMRYFLWNFMGKASDQQNAPAISGFGFDEPSYIFFQTPSEEAGRNVYYALPLLLGLIGMAFHFLKDWRHAFAVSILFFVTGLGIILYLNQTPLQPRERDYSYVASFFAFSLWVGIGATSLIQLAAESVRGAARPVALGVAALLFLAIPGWMTVQNYDDHDRSGRYVAPDYAYNMLMSLEENAIVFTNGDNDTYPLWYLQAVEGVRRDVRVVNLSLLNTPWYIKQLKNQQAYDSAPLPISWTDAQIDDVAPTAHQPRTIELPVPEAAVQRGLNTDEVFVPATDTARVQSPMQWTFRGRPFSDEFNVLYVADLAAFNILATNAQQGWERPIYFAVTVAPGGQLDLQRFFQLEGQAYRVLPIEHDEFGGRVSPTVSPDRLEQFRFTNLDDPDVYLDENIRRLVDNYRITFTRTAQGLVDQGYTERAQALLNRLMEEIPLETIPAEVSSYLALYYGFQGVNDAEQAATVMRSAEPLILHRLQHTQSADEMNRLAQVLQLVSFSYMDVGDFEGASALTGRLAELFEDEGFRRSPDELRVEYAQMVEATSEASEPASTPADSAGGP